MWDNASFSQQTFHMNLHDVGLNSFLVRDCEDLAYLARLIGRRAEAADLESRGSQLSKLIQQNLWHRELGLYVNKFIHNGNWSMRLSPTSFYPMFAGIPSPDQVNTMINKHMMNESEFCVSKTCFAGIPSISRNDPAFKDNNYCKRRITCIQLQKKHRTKIRIFHQGGVEFGDQ